MASFPNSSTLRCFWIFFYEFEFNLILVPEGTQKWSVAPLPRGSVIITEDYVTVRLIWSKVNIRLLHYICLTRNLTWYKTLTWLQFPSEAPNGVIPPLNLSTITYFQNEMKRSALSPNWSWSVRGGTAGNKAGLWNYEMRMTVDTFSFVN